MSYISVPEFIESPFYCGFVSCCAVSGAALSGTISGYIDAAISIMNSFLGRDLSMSDYTLVFRGDDSDTLFTENFPTTGVTSFTWRDITSYRTYPSTYLNNSSILTGNVTDYYLADTRSGLIRVRQGLLRDYEYRLTYSAGYNPIPQDIKTATAMFVVNLAQRTDNMALANPDHTVDSLRVDKIATTHGSAKVIKNVILKSINDLNDIPIPVRAILLRYKSF